MRYLGTAAPICPQDHSGIGELQRCSEFHRAAAKASDNPFIVQALDRITDFIGFNI